MKRPRTLGISWMLAVLLLLIGAASAQAQSEIGTVAAVVGNLQIERGGSWQKASIGVPVFTGDRLRTGSHDRAKIVFADDSVLNLASDTEITLNKEVFDPDVHRFQSLLGIVKGKVRAWVSEYYKQARSRYEVETPTAVAGVRGTEFIVVFDPAIGLTQVVGIADEVEVTGRLAVIGSGVRIGPHFYTQVRKGRFPTRPRLLSEAEFEKFLQGLEIVGTGRPDGLSVLHPAAQGRLLASQDVPTGLQAPASQQPVSGQLQVSAPQNFLGDRLSADVYTNTQPLLDFEQVPPGQAPTGGVQVPF